MAITRSRNQTSPPSSSLQSSTGSGSKRKRTSIQSKVSTSTSTSIRPSSSSSRTTKPNNKKAKIVSNETLDQLLSKSYQNKPVDWPSIQNRIKSHPSEIKGKHLSNILMIHSPSTVPYKIIRELIRNSRQNVYSFSALQFAFTCPWITDETIRALMDVSTRRRPRRNGIGNWLGGGNWNVDHFDGDESQMPIDTDEELDDDDDDDDHDDGHNQDDNSDSDTDSSIPTVFDHNILNRMMSRAKLHTHCTSILHMLFDPTEHMPPRYGAVETMLQCIPRVLEMQDSSDNDLPLHSACWSEQNTQYIELFVKSAMTMDDPQFRFGGLLTRNEFGISPLKLIVQKWSDEKGQLMIRNLIEISNMNQTAIANSKILYEAINLKKWNIAKMIIRLSPQSLSMTSPQWKLPLHDAVYNIPPRSLTAAVVDSTSTSIFEPESAAIAAITAISERLSNNNSLQSQNQNQHYKQHHHLIQYMIEQHMLNIEDKSTCGGLVVRDCHGKTPLFLLCSRRSQSGGDTIDIVKHVLKFIASMKKKKTSKILLGAIVHEIIRIKDWDLFQYIITTYPKSLLLKDKQDNLPIHSICKTDAPFEIIKLVIEEGVKHKVGGRKKRAGLLEANKQGERPLQFIAGRKCSSNGKVLKFLQEYKPKKGLQKLMTVKDIKDLNLLHKVADGGRPVVARALLKCFPKAISIQDEQGNLPLHIVCKCKSNSTNRQLMNLFLEYGIKQNVGGSTGYGGVLVKNNNQLTPMDYTLRNINNGICGYGHRKWSSMKILMRRVPDAPVLQSAINLGYRGPNLVNLVNQYPDCSRVRDSNKQLPLHLALTEGVPPHQGLDAIIDKYPAGLDEFDQVTGLLPFVLASADEKYDITYTYKLLRKSPSYLRP
jgi:hypothetical protein